MKKTKSIRLPYALLLLSVGFAIFAVNSWQRYEILSYVGGSIERIIALDGTVYDIRDAEGDTLWLREMSPEGTLLGSISFSKQGPDNEMKRTLHIIGDHDGLVYLSSYDQPKAAPIQRNGAILVCEPRKGKVYTLCDIDADTDWVWYAAGISDGRLYYGIEDGEAFTIYGVSVDTGETMLWGSAPLPFELSCFSVTEGGVLYAMSPDSRIYRYEETGWQLLYIPGSGMSAVRLSSAGGALYLFTTHPEEGEALLRLDPEADEFITVQEGLSSFYRLNMKTENTWIALTKNHEYHISVNGAEYIFSSLRIPFRLLWDRETTLRTALLWALSVLIVLTVRRLCKRRKFGLMLKLIAATVPIFILGAAVLIYSTARDIQSAMIDNVRASLLSSALIYTQNIDTVRFLQIDWDNPFESDYYLQLRRDMQAHSRSEELIYIHITESEVRSERLVGTYVNYWLYRVEEGEVYTAVNDRHVINQDVRISITGSSQEELNILLGGTPVYLRGYDIEDECMWLTINVPVLHDDGSLVAVLETSSPEWEINRVISNNINRMIVTCLTILSAMLAALAAFLVIILHTLGKLRRGAAAIAAGDFSARVLVHNSDETGDIAKAFNHMAASVGDSVSEITEVSKAFSRFVPNEILSMLGKESIRDVAAAEYIEKQAVFLLLTTESFDVHTEHLESLNRFYARLLPVLSGRGVVERFNSREMRALLSCEPDKAIETSLELLAALNSLNGEIEEEGKTPVVCSILLAYADSFLGVAGDGERLNIILFSHIAHKADDIRAVGLRYGCRLMVEQGVYEALEDVNKFRHRHMGTFSENGRSRDIYDFYDGDTAGKIREKDNVRGLFEQAVSHYYNARYEQARSVFLSILKQQDDPASREYLKKSHERLGSKETPDVLFVI
jgi:HAMP domain-containing protein